MDKRPPIHELTGRAGGRAYEIKFAEVNRETRTLRVEMSSVDGITTLVDIPIPDNISNTEKIILEIRDACNEALPSVFRAAQSNALWAELNDKIRKLAFTPIGNNPRVEYRR